MTAAAPAWLRPLALRPPPTEAAPAWRFLPLCLAAALLLRLALGLFTESNPDPSELHQYLDQGHRLAFGYGVIPFEFHFGLRSWILPGFVAALLLPFKWTGLDDPAYYVPFIRAVFACVSLLIPWGLYHFTRHQHGERTGRIALLLGCASFYLIAFAAKTMVAHLATCAVLGLLGLLSRPFARTRAGAIVFGAVLGLTAFLRYQYLPALGVLWLAAALALPRPWALRSALVAAAAFGAGGLLDWLTWGRPFSTVYVNLLFNLSMDDAIVDVWQWFYPQRLAFASAGGWLLALWAWARRPRAHLPVIALALAVFIPHLLLSNKEFRFVFLLWVLWIPAAAALLAEAGALRSAVLRSSLAPAYVILQLAFGALLAAGAVKDHWLYQVDGVDRGHQTIGYLDDSPQYLRALRWLHRQEGLEGLLVVHNDHSYYHLHRDVPLYSSEEYEEALRREAGRKLVSHVIIAGRLMADDVVEIKRFGSFRVYQSTAPGPVHAAGFDPRMKNEKLWRLAAERLQPAPRRL